MDIRFKSALTLLACSVPFTLSGLLTSCSSSDLTSNKIEDVEQINSTDSKDSVDTKDTSSYEFEHFEKADYHVSGRSAFNYIQSGSEVVLYELDETFTQTGREFTAKTEGDMGSFSYAKVSLVSPYALLKIRGIRSLRRSDEDGPSFSYGISASYFAIADLRTEDSVYLSNATSIEAFRTIDIASKGSASFSEALLNARNSTIRAYYQDTSLITKPFSRMPLNDVGEISSKLLYLIDMGFNSSDSSEIRNVLKDGNWISDSVKIAKAEHAYRNTTYESNPYTYTDPKMVNDFFAQAVGIKLCNEEIRGDSVKVQNSVSSYNNQVLTCEAENLWMPIPYFVNDTLGLPAGHDAEIRRGNVSTYDYAYDSIQGKWLSANLADSIPCITSLIGTIVVTNNDPLTGNRFLVCNDMLHWSSSTASEYANQQKACYSSAAEQVSNIEYIKKFICNKDSSPNDTIIDEPEQTPDEPTLLEREIAANPCGTSEEFRKGVIDTTVYYHCYKGDMEVAKEFELQLGRACNKDHIGYVQYQNSAYSCNGYKWAYASDSLMKDSIVDSRDNQVYKTVGIGSQVWMAENLRYDIDSSWCYGDSVEYCQYGKIYPWEKAVTPKATVTDICPEGWHMPSNAEFDTLVAFAKTWFPSKTIQHILGATKGWEYGGWNDSGEDLLGFAAYPLGYRTLNGVFRGRITSIFLCSADYKEDKGYIYTMNRDDFNSFKGNLQDPKLTCSVRCLKD